MKSIFYLILTGIILLPNVGFPKNNLSINQYTAYIINDVIRRETLTDDYEKLLKIEPNFSVVKNNFYPELLAKL